jgi:hypothetical protein
MCGRYDNLIARDAYRGLFKAKRLPEEILSAAMIVGEPNPLVGGYTIVLPVMLMSEDYDRWLGQQRP